VNFSLFLNSACSVFSAVNKKNTHVETLRIFSLWELLQNSLALTPFNISFAGREIDILKG